MKFTDLVQEYRYWRSKLDDNMAQENEVRDLLSVPKKILPSGVGAGEHIAPQEKYVEMLDHIFEKREVILSNIQHSRDAIGNVVTLEIDDPIKRKVVMYIIFNEKKRSWGEIADKVGYTERWVQKAYKDCRFILDTVEVQYTPIM